MTDLESAVQKLSSFCDSEEKGPKKLDILKKVVSHFFKGENKIHEAVEVIRKCYPLIDKLNVGTEKEKELAAFTLKTIQKYNKRVERHRLRGFAKKAADFMCKKLALITFSGEIAVRREVPDVPFCDEGIALAISEEQNGADGTSQSTAILTEKVIKAVVSLSRSFYDEAAIQTIFSRDRPIYARILFCRGYDR